ncbi:MAG: YjfA family protein [Symplocastrum torsivum CPER-KK1]|jgi:hypothetical protein|uniref:YjfA family protein n=1 Tax=Symplocastrum torsivum CPER-KK1 TaxID=450513 RepID=A0A951PSB0_9CYAN|nr:YjfA family protein [Symplocastrum torsivum CPER-KK1]
MLLKSRISAIVVGLTLLSGSVVFPALAQEVTSPKTVAGELAPGPAPVENIPKPVENSPKPAPMQPGRELNSPGPGCSGGEPAVGPAATVSRRQITGTSRVVELRYNATRRTAWGRITGGAVGDTVWVNRRYSNGGLSGPCGTTQINTGQSTFTPMFNDRNPIQMQACARTVGFPLGTCTGWY